MLPGTPNKSPSTVASASNKRVTVVRVEGDAGREQTDHLVVEEPLAITLTNGPIHDRRRTAVSITMRTPGHDRELAAGYLCAEGVVKDRSEILSLEEVAAGSGLRVDLHPYVQPDLARLERSGFLGSACGLCGKTAIDSIERDCNSPTFRGEPIPTTVIHSLPERLLQSQQAFTWTGGLHAAALFTSDGTLHSVFEDVGRHNAVDKLIGAEFLADRLPLDERIMLVSGRAGFELIQKAAVAGVPVFAAVGAPSSLGVELAQRVGMTLIGFLRDGRFNIYSGSERIRI
jgi:FdhD protein